MCGVVCSVVWCGVVLCLCGVVWGGVVCSVCKEGWWCHWCGTLLSQEAVDVFGLSALDRLFCFIIVREIQSFHRYLLNTLMKHNQFMAILKAFFQQLMPLTSIVGKHVTMWGRGEDRLSSTCSGRPKAIWSCDFKV